MGVVLVMLPANCEGHTVRCTEPLQGRLAAQMFLRPALDEQAQLPAATPVAYCAAAYVCRTCCWAPRWLLRLQLQPR